MITFIVLIGIAVLVFASILLLQAGDRRAQELTIAKNNKNHKERHAAEPASSAHPKTLPKGIYPRQEDDASFLTGENLDDVNVNDIYAEQKLFLRNGINGIFLGNGVMPVEHPIPLRQENIGQGMVREINERTATFNNFRTEQIRLQKMMNDPSFGMHDFSKIVMSDPMLTAKILA